MYTRLAAATRALYIHGSDEGWGLGKQIDTNIDDAFNAFFVDNDIVGYRALFHRYIGLHDKFVQIMCRDLSVTPGPRCDESTSTYIPVPDPGPVLLNPDINPGLNPGL